MFKLPDIPSPRSQINELADFAEWLAWTQGQVSTREILAALGRLDDNSYNIGCDDDADETAQELDEVMNEIERRREASGGGYPFVLDLGGTVLRYSTTDNVRASTYLYLLLATRLNMQKNRLHGGIDGALLFEDLCAHVLANYLGGKAEVRPVENRARCLVFGTGNPGRFSDKITDLCLKLGEGGAFRTLDDGNVDAQDDKLDVVAWVPFSDGKRCQLILFGQCKTGTSWESQKTQLQPDAFIDRWMRDPFLLKPVRTFMLAEASDRSQWCGDSLYAGLLIDRCRIVDFCNDLPDDLAHKIETWTNAAKEQAAR